MTPPSDPLDAVALAVAEFQESTRAGGSADPFAWRERLGEQHRDFLDLIEVEAALDGILDAPRVEPLPRDFGPYRLLRELGRGAVGVVYAAEHRRSGRPAAVKILKADFDLDPTARDRFGREALACARVRHEHVVEIHDSGEVDGRPYFAMALVEGQPLSAAITAGTLPAPRALARELAGVADALDAFHRAGVVHRDVKPSNLMLDRQGRVLLADFGLARTNVGFSLTGTGEAIGTPRYMSPEQLLGRRGEVDGRADVYALGATLYEALCGRPVFAAADLASLASDIFTVRPEPLRKVAPNVPAPLEAIAMKALEKRKEDRYPSAAAMRDDLLAFAQDRAVSGRPVGVVQRAARTVARRWMPIAAGLLVAAGATAWWLTRPARLLLASVPDGAEVWVADVERGRTPLDLSLAPGEYDVVVRTEGFREYRGRVSLDPGTSRPIVAPLRILDAADARALGRLKAFFQLQDAPSIDVPQPRRGTGDEGFEALLPRGDVRLDDLASYRFHVGGRVEGGTLEFRRGGEVLSSEPFDPPKSDMTLPVPAAVLAALRPGDQVTWGWVPPRKPARPAADLSTATFKVVGSEASAGLGDLVTRWAEQPAEVTAELEVAWLRRRGLVSAAARVADEAADARPTSLRLQALAYATYEQLGLVDSTRASRLYGRIQGFPQAERDLLYATAGGAGEKGK